MAKSNVSQTYTVLRPVRLDRLYQVNEPIELTPDEAGGLPDGQVRLGAPKEAAKG